VLTLIAFQALIVTIRLTSAAALIVGYGTPPEHAVSGAVARLCAVLREAARGADPHPWHSMVIGP